MKLLAGLITSVLTATMLALGVSAPAQADHGYASHIDTRANAYSRQNPISAGNRAPFAVVIRAENGESPNASLTVIVKRRRGGDVVERFKRAYHGGREFYSTPRLRKGSYKVIVKADIDAGRYEDARARFGQRVTRR
jgi:hypothetical protein